MDNNTLLEKLFDKVDLIDSRIDSVDLTLIKQNEQLTEHMRRTALAEDQIKQINRHVYMVEGALKVIGLVSAVLGILKVLGII